MTLFYQLVSTAIVCFASLTIGIQYAMPSSTLKLFSSENTTLDRIMTNTEQSLMGSMSSASSLVVVPFCGYLLDTLGRKRSMILFYLPQLLGWLVIVTIFRVEAFIFGMFLCGLSESMLLFALVYINEYCDASIRGRLSSTLVIFNGVGVLISFLLGGLLEYTIISYIGLTLNIICLVLLCLLKESPLYLMKKGFEEDAAQSIAFFKGMKSNSEEVIKEMENIRRLINVDVEIRISPEEEILKPDKNKLKKQLPIRTFFIIIWSAMVSLRYSIELTFIELFIFLERNFSKCVLNHIFIPTQEQIATETINLYSSLLHYLNFYWSDCVRVKSRSTRRALVIVMVLFNLTIFQGVNVAKIFAAPLFETAVPNVTAIFTTVLFAAIMVIAGFIGAYLTDKVGRRILLIVASIVNGLLCVIVATNIQFNWAPSMLTAVLLYCYTFTYGVGVGIVPYVLLGEVFLPQIKGLATMLCVEWSVVCNFTMFYLFVPIFNAYGLGPLFYIFGGFGFLTAFFSFIYLPETKSLPVDVIQTKFLK